MPTKTTGGRKSGPNRTSKGSKAPSKLPSSITLLAGDCREVLPTLEENSIDLIITDPPNFLDGLDNYWHKGGNGSPKGTGAVGGLPVGMKFDPKQGKRLQEFMEEVGQRMLAVTKPGAFALVFSQPRLAPRMAMVLEYVSVATSETED